MHYAAFHEAGLTVLKDDLGVDLGEPAIVTAVVPLGYVTGSAVGSAAALLSSESFPGLEADAYVYENSPDDNQGGSSELRVYHASNGAEWESFLRFDVSSISEHVHRATLELSAFGSGSPDHAMDLVHDNTWLEEGEPDGIDWANRPLEYGETLATWSPVPDATASIDITTGVQRATRWGDMNFSGDYDEPDHMAHVPGADFEALELFLRDEAAYVEAYGARTTFENDILYRGSRSNGNEENEKIDRLDAEPFLARLGGRSGTSVLTAWSSRRISTRSSRGGATWSPATLTGTAASTG